MDLINNLLFSMKFERPNISQIPPFLPLPPIPRLQPKFIPIPESIENAIPMLIGTNYFYPLDAVNEFLALEEVGILDDSINKHWAEMVSINDYSNPVLGLTYTKFTNGGVRIPPYHLIYAYLVENTRAPQIFQKVIEIYTKDEKLTKATSTNRLAFQWIYNTESLFYKNLSNRSVRNITSVVRDSAEDMRRNAYFRLFGIDLAFGNLNDQPVNFYKSQYNNSSFILLFENLLKEFWQGYINASNSSGSNSTDIFSISDIATKLNELLMSRRTTEQSFDEYRYFNLSKEEYASVVMMSWLHEVISYDSPLINFLRCTGNTPGDRLTNIGNKVGVPAHSNSEGLLDIAGPMNTFLRRIELGDFNTQNSVRRIILSQSSTIVLTPPATMDEIATLNDILAIINNWEKATGHKIKNPETNIKGTVFVQQNGTTKQQVNGTMPKQALN